MKKLKAAEPARSMNIQAHIVSFAKIVVNGIDRRRHMKKWEVHIYNERGELKDVIRGVSKYYAECYCLGNPGSTYCREE